MINSFSVALLVLINAFVHLTHANSYYRRNDDQGYQDSSASYVTNFGNGMNKHNIVHVDETSDRTLISGASFSEDESGRPSKEKINVNISNSNHRGAAQGPDVRYNPKSTRTQITNIGNGVGNKNFFVFNDDRHEQPNQRNNQGDRHEQPNQRSNQDGRNEQPNQRNNQGGYQERTHYITNIGKGPDNDNQIYVNNKRVFPSAVSDGDVQITKATERFSSVISDVSRYVNDFGNGKQNNNRIIINGINERVVDPNTVNNNLNVSNKRRGNKTGRRSYYYKMSNPQFKRIFRNNVRNMVRNPPSVQHRRRGWKKSMKNMLRHRYA